MSSPWGARAGGQKFLSVSRFVHKCAIVVIDRSIGSLCSHVAERLDGKRSNVSIYICLLSCLPVRLCNHRILTKANSFAHRRLVLRSRALRARDTCHLVFFFSFPPPLLYRPIYLIPD